MSDISLLDEEMLGASVLIGMLTGGIITGHLGDVFGRKTCTQFSIGLSALAAMASAFTPNVTSLVLCRIIGGFGIGGVVPNIYALAAETFSRNKKDKMMMLIASAWIIGSIYASIAGWVMLGKDINGNRISPTMSWREYALVCGAPSLLAFLLSFCLVESPVFLIDKKQYERAAKSLTYLNGAEVTVADIANCVEEEEKKIKCMPMLRAPLVRPFAVLCVIWFCICFTSYGLLTWVAKLFIDLGYANPFADACIFNLATIPGNFVTVFYVDLIGGKYMLFGGTFLSAFATLVFMVDTSNSVLVVTCACLYSFFNAIGWNALMGVTTDAYFPPETRSSAMGTLCAVGRCGGIIAQFVYGSLQRDITSLLVTTSLVTLVGALAVWLLPAEEMWKPKKDAAESREEVAVENKLHTAEMGMADNKHSGARETFAREY